MDPLFEFGLLIKAGQRDFERRANDAMRPLGLTGAQADALTVIRQAGPKGRRLEKRVDAARDEVIAAGHLLIGDRDLEPVLEMLRDLAQFSPFGQLVARRRELYEGQTQRTG